MKTDRRGFPLGSAAAVRSRGQALNYTRLMISALMCLCGCAQDMQVAEEADIRLAASRNTGPTTLTGPTARPVVSQIVRDREIVDVLAGPSAAGAVKYDHAVPDIAPRFSRAIEQHLHGIGIRLPDSSERNAMITPGDLGSLVRTNTPAPQIKSLLQPLCSGGEAFLPIALIDIAPGKPGGWVMTATPLGLGFTPQATTARSRVLFVFRDCRSGNELYRSEVLYRGVLTDSDSVVRDVTAKMFEGIALKGEAQ